MATKENKRQVRELVEALEHRIHAGPAVGPAEIQSARDFLRRHEFSPASDYFSRLTHLENRLHSRGAAAERPRIKHNYGGTAAGRRMQVQSVYDHLILSTCYWGNFNLRQGRVKISHRFNQEGRIDFVELKYLNSLHSPLNGELRKLVVVRDFAIVRKDWFEAPAQVLKVLPQELIFLYEDIFRCPRNDIVAWLLNIGHGIVSDLLEDLKAGQVGSIPRSIPVSGSELHTFEVALDGNGVASRSGGGEAVCLMPPENRANSSARRPAVCSEQLQLRALIQDEVAMPILEKAAGLEAAVDTFGESEAIVRYIRKSRF